MYPEANYVCRIWRLWWTGLRLMYAIKFFLTFVSRELFKYWRVNAGKWVSFNAHNSSALETQGGGNQLSIKNKKKKKHLFWNVVYFVNLWERERRRIRNYHLFWTEVWHSMLINIQLKFYQKPQCMLNKIKNNNNKDVSLFQDWLGEKQSREGIREERRGKSEKWMWDSKTIRVEKMRWRIKY